MLHDMMMLKLNLILYCLIIIICNSDCQNVRNNVCKDIFDYATLIYNKNCWYDPDVDASPSDEQVHLLQNWVNCPGFRSPLRQSVQFWLESRTHPQGELAARYGFKLESHPVLTSDNYILSVYRLVSNKTNPNLGPILLQHGILMEGTAWMLRGENSPAFYLGSKGYDVWVSNARGTSPSAQHLNLTIEDPDYWDFSFHEIGVYDLPAVIDFIVGNTGKKPGNLIVISHSMGSTSSLIYATIKNNHALKNLKALIATAPVAFMENIESPIKYFAPFGRLIEDVLNLLGFYGIGQFPAIQREIIGKTCNIYPIIIGCEIGNMAVSGVSPKEVFPQSLPVFFHNYPSGTSVKTLQHYAQIINSGGVFQFFNYGSKSNVKFYNSTTPSRYKVGKIGVPVYLMYGKRDFLAGEKDVKILYDKLTAPKQMISIGDETGGFSHNDFLIGKNIQNFYKHLDRVLLKLSQ